MFQNYTLLSKKSEYVLLFNVMLLIDLGGERQHATALYLACKHLPGQLLSSPGEKAGMLAEAAKTLERIGDKKKLQDCYRLMKTLGPNSVTN